MRSNLLDGGSCCGSELGDHAELDALRDNLFDSPYVLLLLRFGA